MKECFGCKENKPLSEFYKNKRSTDGYQPRCKVCMRAAYNSSRAKKKDHYNNVRNMRRRATKARYDEWISSVGCHFCDEIESCCLEPHHLDPSIKEGNVSNMYTRSWEMLMKEVNKCIVVCRNCHAKIHAGTLSVEIGV